MMTSRTPTHITPGALLKNAWWMDGRMDGWLNERIDGWMDRWMDGWMDGWIDEWMDEHFVVTEHVLLTKH